MGSSLIIRKPDGTYVSRIDDQLTSTWQAMLSDVGSFEWHTKSSSLGVAELMALDEARITVIDVDDVTGAVLTNPTVFLWEDDQDDPWDENGPDRELTLTGRDAGALLDRIVTYPVANPSGNGQYQFVQATPGTIILTLLHEGQARGTATEITTSFTTAVDSAGVAWPQLLDINFDPGQSLLQALARLVENVFVDWTMTSLRLDVYIAGEATGLARDMPGILLRGKRAAEPGQNTRQRTRRDLKSVVLVAGDNSVTVERSDATAVAKYGRREAYQAQGGASETGTLSTIGDNYLGTVSEPREALAVAYYAHPDPLPQGVAGSPTPPPVPWRDFRVGDYIREASRIEPDGVTMSKLRVRTMTVIDDGGPRTYTVELNDLLLEQDLVTAAKILALTDGSQAIVATTPADVLDTLAPAAPASVAISTQAYQDTATGVTLAAATLSWTAVTTNSDGTACGDLDHYEVGYLLGTSGVWSPDSIAHMDTTSVFLSGLQPGVQIRARVRSVDHNGNASGYTQATPATLATDATAPNTPSTPAISTMIAGLRINWDGLDNVGAAMPADFARLEVHASTVSGFVPSSATLVDTLRTAGVTPLVDLPYGTTYFVKFVAVDLVGNRSGQSAQASGTASQAVDGDIGSLSITKLTAGQLLADMTVSARIKTATTGKRAELSNLGLQIFDASNAVVMDAGVNGLSMQGAIMAGASISASEFYTSGRAAGRDYSQFDDDGFTAVREGTTNALISPAFNRGQSNGWTNHLAGTDTAFVAGLTGTDIDNFYATAGFIVKSYFTINRVTAANADGYYIQTINATAGQTWTVTVWANATVGMNMRMLVQSVTAASVVTNLQDVTQISAGVWTRLTATVVMPAGTTTARISLWDASNAGKTGGVFYTAAQMELGDHPTSYCDGDQPGCTWAGGPGNYNVATSTRPDPFVAIAMGRSNGSVDLFQGLVIGSQIATAMHGARIEFGALNDPRTILFYGSNELTFGSIVANDVTVTGSNVAGLVIASGTIPAGTFSGSNAAMQLTGIGVQLLTQQVGGTLPGQYGIYSLGNGAGGHIKANGVDVAVPGSASLTTLACSTLTQSSAMSMKAAIKDHHNADALKAVRAIRTVRYQWRKDHPQYEDTIGRKMRGGHEVMHGVLAEDVAEHIPEAVWNPGTDDARVDLMALISYGLAAITEVADRVDALAGS